MFKLDLDSQENAYLFSPKLEKNRILELSNRLSELELKAHIFILSSGSTSNGELKGYAISKEALAANAASVNRHLGLGQNDSWQLSLPHWHIGGLSVFARAKLAGASVLQTNKRWNPKEWARELEGASVTSIVPLQAFDLAKEGVKPPSSLRYLIIGGDLLSSELHASLMELGWPVIRTFGMTEVCSQLATEKKPSAEPALDVLDIHSVKIGDGQRLLVKSSALFSGIFKFDQDFSYTPSASMLQGEYFPTSDLAQIEKGSLVHLGRMDQAFKSKGRLFYFNELRNIVSNYALETGRFGEIELRLDDDERSGKVARLILLRDHTSVQSKIEDELKGRLAPLAMGETLIVDQMNRTELGKLKKS